MLNVFKRMRELKENVDTLNIIIIKELTQRQALEDYLYIEFFQGGKNKPHYRKRKVVTKKRGRPFGSKNKARVTETKN